MLRTTRFAVLCIAAALLALTAPTAFAANLSTAKSSGWVGERSDGTLGLVKSGAPGDVKALVDEVNRKRRASYESIAKQNGTSVDAVASRAGAKLIERTPPGQYVMLPNGKWVQK